MRGRTGNVTVAPVVTATVIAERYGMTREGVTRAIRDGRLPALAIRSGGGRLIYAISPLDAEELFGRPQRDTPPDCSSLSDMPVAAATA